MHNNCLYCNTPFKAKRSTRKYCSDNCKQLAYFKRNGMVFGMNGTKIEDTVKSFTIKPIVEDTVKELYVKPDSVKQNDPVKAVSSVNVKQGENILRQQIRENKEPLPLLSEKQMQELVNRISTALDVKIQQAIINVKKELDVKYASFYGKPDLGHNTPTEVLLCNAIPFKGISQCESEPALKEIKTIIKPYGKDENETLTSNTENTLPESEEHFTINGKKQIPETLPYLELSGEDDDENEGEEENEEDDSELYDMAKHETETVKHDPQTLIVDENENNNNIKEPERKLPALTNKAEQELQENTVTGSKTILPLNEKEQAEVQPEETPQKYEWVQSKFLKDVENDFEESNGQEFFDDGDPDVDWVNVHLRCVAENIGRLSEYNTIDRESLLKLNDALNKIISSPSFNNLPTDYPYTKLTLELNERLNTLAMNKSENISLRINFKTKAKLVSMIYQMNDNVPLLKFNELDFSEAHSENNQPALSGTGKKENKKPRSWKVLHKEHVQAGRIKDDDLDDDEDDNDDEKETGYTGSTSNPYNDRLKYFERTGKFPKKAA